MVLQVRGLGDHVFAIICRKFVNAQAVLALYDGELELLVDVLILVDLV